MDRQMLATPYTHAVEVRCEMNEQLLRCFSSHSFMLSGYQAIRTGEFNVCTQILM